MLTLRGIRKSYAVPVLRDINLELEKGEIHALVGENGAGKSTLSKIICGLVQPDGGTMHLEHQIYKPRSRNDATLCHVRQVMQELSLVPNLTVAENIYLEKGFPKKFGLVDYKALQRNAMRHLASLGMEGIDPGSYVQNLGLGSQQLVDIASSLLYENKILILDESTAMLTENEVQLLFKQIRKLRDQGTSILYISHKLEEIKVICDRISILRNGSLVKTAEASELSTDQMVSYMVGKEITQSQIDLDPCLEDEALRIENLGCGPVENVDFAVKKGEIFGIAGLVGSGRTETLRAIFGADKKRHGHIYLNGSSMPALIKCPRDAVSQGISMVPEERKKDGLLLARAASENIALAVLQKQSRYGWLNDFWEEERCEFYRNLMNIKLSSPKQRTLDLSGGNQQKLLIARWLETDSNIFLWDEPTRGIDMGAKHDIYEIMKDLVSRGKTIVWVSCDLRELMMMSHRIGVMSQGVLVDVFDRKAWSQKAILAAAFSRYVQK